MTKKIESNVTFTIVDNRIVVFSWQVRNVIETTKIENIYMWYEKKKNLFHHKNNSIQKRKKRVLGGLYLDNFKKSGLL